MTAPKKPIYFVVLGNNRIAALHHVWNVHQARDFLAAYNRSARTVGHEFAVALIKPLPDRTPWAERFA